MSEFKFPTEMVELPSKGLVYPEGTPLAEGKIEMKYMTAKEEDILTNQSYIQDGTVLDKLLQSLIVDKFDIDDLYAGDKNAILIASRILGYGSDYEFIYKGKEYTVDLSTLENKSFNESLINTEGYFEFILPKSGNKLEVKLLFEKDEKNIEEEINGLKKINKNISHDVTTRLKHMIISVEGNKDKNEIKSFVENYLLAQDARALRKFIQDISPDVDMNYTTDSGEEVAIPINLNFFWPDI
jgi:hypothetical protein